MTIETPADLVIGLKGGDRIRLRFADAVIADDTLKALHAAMRGTEAAVASIAGDGQSPIAHVRVGEVAWACHAAALVNEGA